MSLILAGLTVLVIGDSHMATKGYLISTLHDELMQQGAIVYSYGACGSPSGDWMKVARPPCGSAYRLGDGPLRERNGEVATTKPLPVMVTEHHPDLIVVVNGDTMASYKAVEFPKSWIWSEISSLTKGVKESGVSCVWVGPGWGTEGGKIGKTYDKAKRMSSFLEEIVAPCVYINSLKMAQPGEWRTTTDGVHYTESSYQKWGRAIFEEIISMDFPKINRH